MALDYIQPVVQVRKVAKLLELVTIRVKRGEIPETLESSREIEEMGLEISPPSVITVSRGDCFATGETVRDEVSSNNGDAWRQSGLLRDYLDALCGRCVPADQAVPLASPLADYLRWGFAQADRRDPLRETPSSVLDESVDETDLEQGASIAPGKPR